MTPTQLPLFGNPAEVKRPLTPAAPRAQAIGRAHIAPESDGIRGFVAGALFAAGPVSADGSRGGLTLCELAEAVSRKRGKHTKETSLTQPLKDLRGENDKGEVVNPVYVRDSGKLRMGNSGVRTTVWCHTAHDRKREGGAR